MDVDKLFKLPKLPSSATNKRKWAEPSVDALKAARVEDDEAPQSASAAASSSRAPASGDGSDDGGDFAPGNDADYFAEEDDEGGRFFGGGLTAEQKRILAIMATDERDAAERRPEEQLRELRRALLRCERAVSRNQQLRVKHADAPEKFIESEAELHGSLGALVVLTTNPPLFYPEAVRNSLPQTLCALLSHENVDIVAKVVELVEEMTDDDVLDVGISGAAGADDDDDEAPERAGEKAVGDFVDVLLGADFLALLVPNLTRLNDEAPPDASATAVANAESDASTIYHILGCLENFLALRPRMARDLASGQCLAWLMQRCRRKGRHDQNRGYAAELLAVLVQGEEGAYVCERLGRADGIDHLLEVLSRYRKGDPSDAEELEFVENVFDVLCAVLALKGNKTRFVEAEGPELMCIFLREKKASRLQAVKALDFALTGPEGAKGCVRFVESMGLGPLFSLLMGKGAKKHDAATSSDEEHMLGLIVSLLNNLESESPARIRLLAKFVEDDYEKADRLLELFETSEGRLQAVEAEIKAEQAELEGGDDDDMETLYYLRRLSSGLHMAQQAAYALAWLVMEDDGLAAHVKLMLSRKGGRLDGQLVERLKEWYANVGDDVVVSEADEAGAEDLRLKDVIVQLVNYLLGVA